MRYFLDCEYDGPGGALLSLALVPDDGGEEFYVVIPPPAPVQPWVERHVVPYLHSVPAALDLTLDRIAAAHAVAAYLGADPDPVLVADWPEDLSLAFGLLVTGEAEIADLPGLSAEWVRLPGFSVAANSRVPHNALHDARALRDHLLMLED